MILSAINWESRVNGCGRARPCLKRSVIATSSSGFRSPNALIVAARIRSLKALMQPARSTSRMIERKPLLAEVGDRLPDAVLENGEIVFDQIGDDAPGLLLPGKNAYVHQVGSRFQYLIVRGVFLPRYSLGRSARQRGSK